MKIPWPGDQCILCSEKKPFSDEHIIPQALGGRLTCKFLCTRCNSELGRGTEMAARSDPSTLLAAQNLEDKIPKLARELIENHPHIGHSEPGPAPGYVRNGQFHVCSRKLEDGSIVQPSDNARQSVSTTLRRRGSDEGHIAQALRTFDHTPENEKVQVAGGLRIVKWAITRVEPDFTKARPMDPLIPVKVAFEFLALHLGTAIYENGPPFLEIRGILRSGALKPDFVKVDRLSSNKYEPFHGICFEGNNPYAKVQIRFFGWLAFRVHFLHLAVGGPRFIYTHRLDTCKEWVDVVEEKI